MKNLRILFLNIDSLNAIEPMIQDKNDFSQI